MLRKYIGGKIIDMVVKKFLMILFIPFLTSCEPIYTGVMATKVCLSAPCGTFLWTYFKTSVKMRFRADSDSLLSDEGVDRDKNNLRDDLDIYIDEYFGIERKFHPDLVNALKQHAVLMYNFSILRVFTKEDQDDYLEKERKTEACLYRISDYYNKSSHQVGQFIVALNYIVLKNYLNKSNYIKNFYEYSFAHGGAQLEYVRDILELSINCNFKISNAYEIQKQLISYGDTNKKNSVRRKIGRYEKEFGIKHRMYYEQLYKFVSNEE